MRKLAIAVVLLALLGVGVLTAVGTSATGRSLGPGLSAKLQINKLGTRAELAVNNTGNTTITYVAFLPYGGWKIAGGGPTFASGICHLVPPGMLCDKKVMFAAGSGGSFEFDKISGALGGGYAWIKKINKAGTTGQVGPILVAGPNGKLPALPGASKNLLAAFEKALGLH
jgi:hypothetical protein